MTREKPEKGPRTRAQARKDEVSRRRKRRDADSGSDSGQESEENEELDMEDYREFLSKLFPSKHMDEKVRNQRRRKKRKAVSREEEERSVYGGKAALPLGWPRVCLCLRQHYEEGV